MIEIKNLNAGVEGKQILKGISMALEKGKAYVLMGKNGSGKSTLANVVMGNPKNTVSSGEILLNGKSILKMSPDERARKGIFMSFQSPVEVPGVRMGNFLRSASNSLKGKKLSFLEFQNKMSNNLKILGINEENAERYANEGLSGGEKKKSELFQAMVLDPQLIIFDEIDSGLDADSLKTVSEQIKKMASMGKTILVITHYKKILDYINPEKVFVMEDGKIVLNGGREIAEKIEEKGYKWLKGEK